MEREEEIISMLDGELDQEKKSELKALIENDPDLLEDNVLFEKIIQGIKKEGDEQLKDELTGYLKDYLNESKKGKAVSFKRPITYISIAASLLLGLFFINIYTQDQNDPVILRSQEVPVKLDSATYKVDSLNSSVKKNIE